MQIALYWSPNTTPRIIQKTACGGRQEVAFQCRLGDQSFPDRCDDSMAWTRPNGIDNVMIVRYLPRAILRKLASIPVSLGDTARKLSVKCHKLRHCRQMDRWCVTNRPPMGVLNIHQAITNRWPLCGVASLLFPGRHPMSQKSHPELTRSRNQKTTPPSTMEVSARTHEWSRQVVLAQIGIDGCQRPDSTHRQ